ncbi:MAG: class I SAM-dependent methyltransferase [Planctomycetota bacterium]
MPRTCLADAREVINGGRSGFASAMPPGLAYRHGLRKWWEWDAIARSCEALGVLHETCDAVGLGVGAEPLMFYLAQRCRSVVGLDRYADDSGWREARFAGPDLIYEVSPVDYPRDRLRVIDADMRRLPLGDESCDLVWSCSSVEHVARPAELLEVFREVHRVLRPGGVAVITTEYALLETPYLMPGVLAWDAGLMAWLRAAMPGFAWEGPTDLSYEALHPGNAPVPRRDLWQLEQRSDRPWDGFRAGGVTRLGGISLLTPILSTLRKAEGSVLAWDQADVPENLKAYGNGLGFYAQGQHAEAAGLLAPLFDELSERSDQRQWALHAARILLECRAIGEPQATGAIRAVIDRMLGLSLEGALQDADCLDLCGYLLAEIGDEEAAWQVDRSCIESPSTTAEHVMQLAARNVIRGRGDAARVKWLRDVVVDLRDRMVPAGEIDRHFNAPVRAALGTQARSLVVV